MPLTLSDQHWKELWDEGLQTGAIAKYSDGFIEGERGYCPKIGAVHEWSMSLLNGLRLRLYDYHLDHSLRLTSLNHGYKWSALSFFITGTARTHLQGLTDDIDESPGGTYLSCVADVPESEDWVAKERMLRVHVNFAPIDFLSYCSRTQLQSLPVEIQQAAIDGKLRPYYYPGTMTSAMQMAIHQILHCPYQGLMQRFYLESKALELMTLYFCQFQERHPATKAATTLKADDIECIHRAKDILIANFDNPPSLMELAHQVAINDHKLKQGFRQVFGTTVFGYLRDYRLEQARYLLSSGHKVMDVTHKIGFADRSHFAAAFRKKFGLNPGEYAKQQRF